MQNNKHEQRPRMTSKMDQDLEEQKAIGTDSIIHNLMNLDRKGENGNLINDEGNGSFSNINTSVYGVEVDVDDL